jgi:hypothetical protein
MVKLNPKIRLVNYAGVHGKPVNYRVWLYRQDGVARLEIGGDIDEPIEYLCGFDLASEDALVACVDELVRRGAHPDSTVTFQLFWHYDHVLISESQTALGWFVKTRALAAA